MTGCAIRILERSGVEPLEIRDAIEVIAKQNHRTWLLRMHFLERNHRMHFTEDTLQVSSYMIYQLMLTDILARM